MTHYLYDDNDPDAPKLLPQYRGIRAGDQVRYVGPIPLDRDPQRAFVVSELVEWELSGDLFDGGEPEVHRVAVLDNGTWEVNADNLEKIA